MHSGTSLIERRRLALSLAESNGDIEDATADEPSKKHAVRVGVDYYPLSPFAESVTIFGDSQIKECLECSMKGERFAHTFKDLYLAAFFSLRNSSQRQKSSRRSCSSWIASASMRSRSAAACSTTSLGNMRRDSPGGTCRERK